MLPGKTFTHLFSIRIAQRIVIPDALPVCVLIRDGVDTVVTVNIASTIDGGYKAQTLIPSDWVEGDLVHLRITANKDGYTFTKTELLGEVNLSQSATQRNILRLAKIHGLTNTPVTASDTSRATGDRDVSQTITTNPNGSKTMSGSP